MIIKIVRQGRTEVITDATLLVVEDNVGNPVSVAAQPGLGRSFIVSCIDDDVRFNQVLHNLGIDRVVIKVPVDSQLQLPSRLPYLIGNQ